MKLSPVLHGPPLLWPAICQKRGLGGEGGLCSIVTAWGGGGGYKNNTQFIKKLNREKIFSVYYLTRMKDKKKKFTY